MGTFKKTASLISGALCAATAVVAAKNAVEVKWEESAHEQGFYEKYVKRPQDFFCASLATVVMSPVLAGTALSVRRNLGTPVLFTQERPGKDEKIFRLVKFRTMTDERDENGDLLPDEERLTKFGRWLRTTSLDELPELINIIRGDMAVVGPRPLLVGYLDRYNEMQHHRHDVRPGLTGYAQVHGRNALSWEDKFVMDLWYAENVTFVNDLRIIWDTVRVVLSHEGISSETSETMEEFKGAE